MIAFIGIGANLGDARANVEDAVQRLSALSGCRLLSTSSLWRTAPFEAAGDDYINAVAMLDTTLSAPDLLSALQQIERDHGRERPYRNAPRTLDLDVLLYGDAVIHSDTLQVPHPRMHERAFVLVPLLEVAPEARIPGHGRAADFVDVLKHQVVTRLA